jgi:transcriptional regulator with XRE-family HTH domain
VAEAIVEFRNRVGITQEALAAELEICVRQIQYFEAGALIKPPVLRRLAKFMAVRDSSDLAAFLKIFTRRETNVEPIEQRLAKAEQLIQALALRLAQVEQNQDRPRDNLRLVGGGVA